MSQQLSLRDAERKVFSITYADCLWDIFLGCFFLMFALAPLLSRSLGDFWSSVVFLPFWGIVYLLIRWLRRNVVAPRIGRVRFGQPGRTRLVRFNLFMLGFNLLALILGIVVATRFGSVPGQMTSIGFGLLLLIGFSLAATLLGLSRLYIYGLLVGLSPLVGEWLYTHHNASHHGFPITFGAAASIMFLVGLALFLRLLRENRLPFEGIPPGDA